ncbi:acyl-CoA dehydrogenase [Anaeromyxobacter diazotrophicus]|uniref:3-methylmercaptopropionyl-CoA dehydrogenase n=1 Tax=Anaeromyxobacter diazotrophicus TaxID=2590199 RepID=A0A7I9VMY1_9BACT|nr:acyl-CoA dehydrogenase [Anaeromyxobacter diazotrophicus]GEJ57762.1 acyl-CoA dehydrogenase [Anaeromyxobacter diazotrophicus]
MKEYTAPLRDMHFVLRELTPLEEVARLPGCEDATREVTEAILTEAGKFASGVLSPLNRVGDREGARWRDGEVTTAPGWRDAYRQFVEAGWNALSCDPEHGGQGLPRLVSALVDEMWNGANVAFALCPMLTRGAIEAIELRGSEALRRTYLPKLVSGEWTGTMVLTEPQAGSDLASVRTRAVPQGDGTYKLEGQKIFITYGEHDLAENIVHLVLARTPDAPEGVKGISLFVVPKFLPKEGGGLGARNDVRCVSIEHKLGIHGSPTAVLAFGDQGGAVGWLVGEEHRGLEYMFIMMNAARFAVGLEGIGISERAYQRALDYARERLQGTELGARSRERVAIVRHPDVRRMLMLMKSRTEAMRALACAVAAATDTARRHPDAARRQERQAFVDLMIPVVKGWATEMAVENASLGVQIHGGMGYVEETGAAQHLRDARITPIYEGTTGIQAADLIGRKIARDRGAAAAALIREVREVEGQLGRRDSALLAAIGARLHEGLAALERATEFVVGTYGPDVRRPSVGAVPFLDLLGTVAGGWQMARAALVAHQRLGEGAGEAGFYRAKLATARFYADHVLARAPGLALTVVEGAEGALAIEDDQL